jgi:uncharacterized membrane protein YgdD (TMEM256/DUF423 family)
MTPPELPILGDDFVQTAQIPQTSASRSMFYSKSWGSIGAIMATLGVVLGAFGAHGADRFLAAKYAESRPVYVAGEQVPLAQKRLNDYDTGVRYHLFHALGLVAVGLLSRMGPKKSLQIAGWSFLLGIMLFSGSLYYLALTGLTWLGMITPVGGVLFIVGWIALAVAASPAGAPEAQPHDPSLDDALA